MRPSLFAAVLLAAALLAGPLVAPAAAQQPRFSTGQTIYVPAYGHIYHGSLKKPFYLTVTLSVRNTDVHHPLTVEAVDYYDTEGKLLSHRLDEPATVGPLGTLEVVVEEQGEDGGSGDNFLVRWSSAYQVTPPLVESVMIGTASAQGISFTSRGVVIKE